MSLDSLGSAKRQYYDVKVSSHEKFTVDVRYTDIKRIGSGSYGCVCSGEEGLLAVGPLIKAPWCMIFSKALLRLRYIRCRLLSLVFESVSRICWVP